MGSELSQLHGKARTKQRHGGSVPRYDDYVDEDVKIPLQGIPSSPQFKTSINVLSEMRKKKADVLRYKPLFEGRTVEKEFKPQDTIVTNTTLKNSITGKVSRRVSTEFFDLKTSAVTYFATPKRSLEGHDGSQLLKIPLSLAPKGDESPRGKNTQYGELAHPKKCKKVMMCFTTAPTLKPSYSNSALPTYSMPAKVEKERTLKPQQSKKNIQPVVLTRSSLARTKTLFFASECPTPKAVPAFLRKNSQCVVTFAGSPGMKCTPKVFQICPERCVSRFADSCKESPKAERKAPENSPKAGAELELLGSPKVLAGKKDIPARRIILKHPASKGEHVGTALIEKIKKAPLTLSVKRIVKQGETISSVAEKKRVWKGENGLFKNDRLQNWYKHMPSQ